MRFLKKNITFFFGHIFQKYCLNQKFEEKKYPFLEKCLNMLFKQFDAFLTQSYCFSLSQKFLTKKSDFLAFSQKKNPALFK